MFGAGRAERTVAPCDVSSSSGWFRYDSTVFERLGWGNIHQMSVSIKTPAVAGLQHHIITSLLGLHGRIWNALPLEMHGRYRRKEVKVLLK